MCICSERPPRAESESRNGRVGGFDADVTRTASERMPSRCRQLSLLTPPSENPKSDRGGGDSFGKRAAPREASSDPR